MSRLPGQSLMILDRATMAYSLESRSPFLDPRFAEFMARVPVAAQDPRAGSCATSSAGWASATCRPRCCGGRSRGSPRRSCTSWRTRCARWRRALLLGSELVRDGYLEGRAVRQLVEEHLARRRDHGNRIWLLLSAEVWYRRYIGRRSPRPISRWRYPSAWRSPRRWRAPHELETGVSARSTSRRRRGDTAARAPALVLRLGERSGDDHPGRRHPALPRRQRLRRACRCRPSRTSSRCFAS